MVEWMNGDLKGTSTAQNYETNRREREIHSHLSGPCQKPTKSEAIQEVPKMDITRKT